VWTFVALAKALDPPPVVGVLQAEHGNAGENGLALTSEDSAAMRAALAASPNEAAIAAGVAQGELELAAPLAALPNGGEGWATADLDINGDGRVGEADVETAPGGGVARCGGPGGRTGRAGRRGRAAGDDGPRGPEPGGRGLAGQRASGGPAHAGARADCVRM
jgi:hypothetical protein